MRFVAAFENPWCLFSLLLVIVLLLMAAALVSLSRQRERAAQRRRARRQPQRPPRGEALATTGPFEGLQAIGERLAEIERHLPASGDDARWLQSYRNDLRNVLDDLYWQVAAAPEAEREALLERMGGEVADLEQTIAAGLSASLGSATDRSALREQLEQLRRALDN